MDSESMNAVAHRRGNPTRALRYPRIPTKARLFEMEALSFHLKQSRSILQRSDGFTSLMDHRSESIKDDPGSGDP
jgi:hypothetical protein